MELEEYIYSITDGNRFFSILPIYFEVFDEYEINFLKACDVCCRYKIIRKKKKTRKFYNDENSFDRNKLSDIHSFLICERNMWYSKLNMDMLDELNISYKIIKEDDCYRRTLIFDKVKMKENIRKRKIEQIWS